MRRFRVAAVLSFLFAASRLCAGPLFDDFLNYARMGENSPVNSAEVVLTTDRPIGQTFAVAPGTGEIYRIGLQANSEPDSWGEGEVVTLTLYDSPSKQMTLGSYTIDWRTCRIRGIGLDARLRILLFPLRAKLNGQQTLYFELTLTGGDGSVRFKSDPGGTYEGGTGWEGGKAQLWDLAFETHVKPVPDREANLKAFWEKINLDYPPLAKVKAAVEAGDYDTAEEEFVNHFHNRLDLYEPSLFEPKPEPDFDRTFADLLMSGNLWKTQDGKVTEVIPWRKESYWAPDYVEWGKDYEPDITGGWHIERTLYTAYSMTGDEKYARAGIDLRMQWILDNVPSPKVTGIPAPHDIWNELSAGRGRAPGHLPWIYSRIHEYPGMSVDEKMLYFLNWYENADYLYRSNVGGNWGFQAADSCYNFGKTFPEFKKSKDFMSWGAQRITQLSLETVRPDGTQQEAAIKYHAMCARRLKSLMRDYRDGVITLDADFVPTLERNLELMYEHMAYVLQPDNRVVMYGDAWYEDYHEEVAEVGRMVNRPDLVWIATQGREGEPPSEISKAYPDGGYFIMRNHFGGKGKPYADAVQSLVHNGGWVGGHGHFDLLSMTLYGYGRTLLVDPGGMWDNEFPAVWWKSDIHSMLVANSWDCSRDPGTTRWVSSRGFDYLDGIHHGYRKQGIEHVRRRIAFVKPDYFIVDDSISPVDMELQWDQCWNVLARSDELQIDHERKIVHTDFASGGNVLLYPADGNDCEIVTRSLRFPMDGPVDSTIVYYRARTGSPRFTTVVYPYQGKRPDIRVSSIPANGEWPNTALAVKMTNGNRIDLAVWGDSRKGPMTFGEARHLLYGDFLLVRSVSAKIIEGFSWHNASRAVFNGLELARADSRIALLDVTYGEDTVTIEVREPDPSLVVWVGDRGSVIVNGKNLTHAKPYKGYLRLFADMPKAIVVDDDSPDFQRVTQTNEWETIAQDTAYGLSYTRHETDPGRHESALYSAAIPVRGMYALEVFIPETTRTRTDAMHYRIALSPTHQTRPVPIGGAIADVRRNDDTGDIEILLDQQRARGWVRLGEFELDGGHREVLMATNRTDTDGLYPVFDAMRLLPVKPNG